MTRPSRLVVEDHAARADLVTFVGRALRLDPTGAIRLLADGPVLAGYVGVLPGRGLLGEGTVLGMRTTRLAEDARIDVVVSLAEVRDRLERQAGAHAETELELPSDQVSASWAALTPPRGGWESVGTLDSDALEAVARSGIAEVADGAGTGSGGQAVAELRHRVWGRLTATVPPVPAGAAFGAYALGFLVPGGAGDVVANGRWTRLSTPLGHVLVR